MFSHLIFNGVLLLLLLLLARSLENAVIVEVGKNAYLPCDYSLAAYGTPVPVCWGKGPCSWSHCGANKVLSTDERNVTYQKSRRYQLKGNFLKGDVSLTIENVTLADRGTYCCRVEFTGPGNDKKVNLELDIRPAKFAPAVPARGYPTPTSPRTLTTKGDGSETQTLGTLQDKSQTLGRSHR
ncbi:hepatitis A virus cellular receptor 2 homolog isoform X2 [Microtus oregoni]|uniref:hepatitis A virus cellular receptor 2 homolog isoform X2 n=1 Tax=Microtus oregoni TaxID=111838 RepID=UPI001BB2A381|nr:hepatitis A virus cellular receptor 2 homolog isoform X2 [Microtus oregoni]